jgi:arylsulfatase A-like enzyme
MMHVPLIFHHPGSIPSGKSDAVVTNCDFLPSVLEYVGLENRIPEKPKLPGKSYAPILRGEEVEWPIDMYYEMESCRSVRNERWKYVERRSPDGPGELYDLEIDPMERVNLFNQKGYEKIQKEMAEKLYAFFDKYADPEYDIWNGGRSKARRHHAPADHPDYRKPKPRPWKAAVEKGKIYEK